MTLFGREAASTTPEFGTPGAPGSEALRQAAYAVIRDAEGRFLVVRAGPGLFLPGGGRRANESAADAVVREVLEQVGAEVAVGTHLGTAVQHFEPHGSPIRMTADFYSATLLGAPSDRGEHEVVWRSAQELSGRMYHECHEWIVEKANAPGVARDLPTDGPDGSV